MLPFPGVEGMFADPDPQLRADFCGLLSAFRLPERLKNLLLGVTLPRHLSVLSVVVEDYVQAVSSTHLWLSFSVLGQT